MMFVDFFSSGLDDLTRKQARDYQTVLRILEREKRFSVFDATANAAIAKTMTDVIKRGYVTTTICTFPWTSVELTDAGRALAHPTTSQQNKD